MLDLTTVEMAMMAAVSALQRPYLANSVYSYGGEFDDEISDVVRRFPAVWVTFGGAGVPKRFNMSSGKWFVPLTFVTMVGARNVRNEATTRQGVKSTDGTTIEPGTYQLLADVQTALVGNDLGLDIDPLAPGKIGTLYNTKLRGQSLSVLTQEWRTRCVMSRPLADAPWLQSIAMSYLVQPSDETPDAEDTLILEADGGSFADGRHKAGGSEIAG